MEQTSAINTTVGEIKETSLVNYLSNMIEKHLIKPNDPIITLFYLYELRHTTGEISHKLFRLSRINSDLQFHQTLKELYRTYNYHQLIDQDQTKQFTTKLNTIIKREENIGHSNVDAEEFPFKVLNEQKQQELVTKELAKDKHLYRIQFTHWKNAEELRQCRDEITDLYNFLWEIYYIDTHTIAINYHEFIHRNLAVLAPEHVEKLSLSKLHTPLANEHADNNQMCSLGNAAIFTIMNTMISEIKAAPIKISYLENYNELSERWPYLFQTFSNNKLPETYTYQLTQTFFDIVYKLSTRLYQKNELIGIPTIESI
ncbi:hypothetical protein GO495_06585 [Chitinophaga oryziterrae]|uniref:Uncharacterized protein n=1 Tax=Chitinophaga oryziterrae TaxID=1031224 RepID=A0A6N8J6I3_9BACT|nr:hypothetical protein [Chitinophaga oryziterrae]MVT40241.1 hypothetical protein [Chitinophaga oryziterrae]